VHYNSSVSDFKALAQRQLHLWFAAPDEITDVDLLQRYRAVLSPAERTRADRFRKVRDQKLYLVAHAMLRTVLSRYAEVPPTDWTFDEGPYGRPEISNPIAHNLRFNLSHTHGLCLCGVVLDLDLGVDVETVERDPDVLLVAERFFSTAEFSTIPALPPEQQKERFFTFWTLKEAYIKARGAGLSLPLDQFSFTLAPEISINFDPRMQQHARDWSFGIFHPTLSHRAAFALKTPATQPYDVACYHVVPLLHHHQIATKF